METCDQDSTFISTLHDNVSSETISSATIHIHF